jgi:HEAT repeat protein
LQAISHNTDEDAGRLALAGLSHPSAEVRRRACVHLGEHFEQSYAPALIRVLSDTDTNVSRAAVQALAEAESLGDPQPVTALLTSHDKLLRVEAATTLARLGSTEGPAALERLAFYPDLNIRREAAEAMGRLADPQYTATLVRLLDERVDVSRAALGSLQQVTSTDGPEIASLASPTERIGQWKRWWKEKRL